MNLKRHLRAALAALLLAATLAPAVIADEGMWPFNQVPRAEIKRKYGFEVTDEFLKKLQLASVRFPNGSGSFVSPDGLVLTNYNIVEDAVAELSTAQKDYTKDGFVARTRAEELKIPGYELNVLQSIEDVTDRVNASVKTEMSADDAFNARRTAIVAIEKESTEKTGFRSDVVTLYQGGKYNLYRYKKYTDVRLVFAPEFQAAFFGGDPDNFEFPRFNIDMGLVRAYENNKPARVEHYFRWSEQGAKDGDLVFVTGHPGSTQRLNTVAHIEALRETSIPLVIRMLERREAVLKKYMAMGEEQTRRGQNELNSTQNALKVYRGQLGGLKDPSLISYKRKSEDTLRKAVMSNPQRQKEYGDAWDAIAKGRRDLAAYERDRRFLDLGAGFNTVLFNYARTLVRLAEESTKQNAERLPEFTDARRASLENVLFAQTNMYDDYEKMKLADSLDFLREAYGADHELVKRILAGKTPEARAAELIDGTKLKSVGARKALVAGGRNAVEESDDPFIQLARSVDAEARAANRRYSAEVLGVERASYAKIARAVFETKGDRIYPDATFTLRLSFGVVKGYTEDGKKIAPFTTLCGLYARAEQFGRKFPYALPPRWEAAKSKVDLKTPFNFVSTNDIIGGNFGSPIVNKEGELVGLIFDGNRQSLVGNFYYDESVNRAISVDSRGMLEALRKVYSAEEVADELARHAAPAESSHNGESCIGDSVRDEDQAVFSKPVKINAESSNLLMGESATLKTRQEVLRANLTKLEAQPILEPRKSALFAATSEAKQNLNKTRGVFLGRIESGFGLSSTEETRRAAQTLFRSFELEYDKTLQEIKELTPGNYTSVRDNTLQLLDFNASAYAVIAENQSLTFNLLVKSNPPQSAISYKREGDADYTPNGSETNATIDNLLYAIWHVRVELPGYVAQEKPHDAWREQNHVIDFQLAAKTESKNVQPTIKQASPGRVPKSASKRPSRVPKSASKRLKKAGKAKTVRSSRKH